MKKIISTFLAIAGLTAFFTGCAESTANLPDSSAQESSKAERVSNAPIDPEIIGKWSNGVNGYIFGENRKVALFMDFSAIGTHFTESGDFSRAGELVGTDSIEYDGTNLVVNYSNIDAENGVMDMYVLANMTRKDAANPDSFDGLYTLNGGAIVEFMSDMGGMDYYEDVYENSDFSFEAVVDGENFYVTFGSYCNYETLGNSLELFSKYMNYVDETATSVKYNYEIDGNTLTMIYTADETAPVEIYSRVEE